MAITLARDPRHTFLIRTGYGCANSKHGQSVLRPSNLENPERARPDCSLRPHAARRPDHQECIETGLPTLPSMSCDCVDLTVRLLPRGVIQPTANRMFIELILRAQRTKANRSAFDRKYKKPSSRAVHDYQINKILRSIKLCSSI